MKAANGTEWARFMTDDEYYLLLVKKNIRPAIWRWRDIELKADGASAAESLRGN
jgi:hypothetical protein